MQPRVGRQRVEDEGVDEESGDEEEEKLVVEGANGACPRWHGDAVDVGCLPYVTWLAPGVCGSSRDVDLDGLQEFGKKCARAATARLTSCSFALRPVVARDRLTTGT